MPTTEEKLIDYTEEIQRSLRRSEDYGRRTARQLENLTKDLDKRKGNLESLKQKLERALSRYDSEFEQKLRKAIQEGSTFEFADKKHDPDAFTDVQDRDLTSDEKELLEEIAGNLYVLESLYRSIGDTAEAEIKLLEEAKDEAEDLVKDISRARLGTIPGVMELHSGIDVYKRAIERFKELKSRAETGKKEADSLSRVIDRMDTRAGIFETAEKVGLVIGFGGILGGFMTGLIPLGIAGAAGLLLNAFGRVGRGLQDFIRGD